MAAVWWVVAALLLLGAELLSLDLILGMLAIGCLAAALAAALGAEVIVQVIVAAVVSLLMILLVRPIALRHLRGTKETLTGTAALVGQDALVLEQVDTLRGRVKIGGEIWSARIEGAAAIQPGATVTVLRIDGATAVVAASIDGSGTHG